MLKKKSGSSAPSKKTTADTAAGAEKPLNKQEKKDAGKRPAKTGKEAPAPERLFPIVGVGASAGGLEAFTQLLENLPLDTGMGFILLQHMAPRSHSMLPEILAKVTRLPVGEARDGMRVEPNRIYVTPPSIAMTLEGGVLRLRTREEPRGQHRPIDVFLRSLAADQGSRAIGVILSGTASDGVLGLQAIKAEGGITFAQEVKSAKYAGMPESAIAAGVVDFVLTPDQIARRTGPPGPPSFRQCSLAGQGGRPPKKKAISTRYSLCCRQAPGWILPITSPAPSSGASTGA